jgi:hypothetical protein
MFNFGFQTFNYSSKNLLSFHFLYSTKKPPNWRFFMRLGLPKGLTSLLRGQDSKELPEGIASSPAKAGSSQFGGQVLSTPKEQT